MKVDESKSVASASSNGGVVSNSEHLDRVVTALHSANSQYKQMHKRWRTFLLKMSRKAVEEESNREVHESLSDVSLMRIVECGFDKCMAASAKEADDIFGKPTTSEIPEENEELKAELMGLRGELQRLSTELDRTQERHSEDERVDPRDIVIETLQKKVAKLERDRADSIVSESDAGDRELQQTNASLKSLNRYLGGEKDRFKREADELRRSLDELKKNVLTYVPVLLIRMQNFAFSFEVVLACNISSKPVFVPLSRSCHTKAYRQRIVVAPLKVSRIIFPDCYETAGRRRGDVSCKKISPGKIIRRREAK